MKTTLILALALVSLSMPARAAELCGLLVSGCSGTACQYVVKNAAGLHPAFSANDEAERALREHAGQNICATGRDLRQGFEAVSVRKAVSLAENDEESVTEDVLCLHNAECGHNAHHKIDSHGCVRCVKNK